MKNTMRSMFTTVLHSTKLALATALVLTATSGVAFANAPKGGGGGGVPELDPSSMMGAFALLSGGVLMLTDKIRRK